jgi:hypothetical protein
MVNEVLTTGQPSRELETAIDVLQQYAEHDLKTLAESDIYRPALISVHHASTLFARIGATSSEGAHKLGNKCEGLPEVTEAIYASLAALLDSAQTIAS